MNYEFRPVRVQEREKIKILCESNGLEYDPEFVSIFLNDDPSSQSFVLGCFDGDKLIGIYALFVYKLLFAGVIQDAATVTYNIIDKTLRRKGLGIKIAEKMIGYIKGFEIDLVFSFIDKKMVGKWSNAINECWRRYGFNIKELSLISPCFKTDKAKKSEAIKSGLPLMTAKKLFGVELEEVIEFSDSFYANFTIAELPDERSVIIAKQFPEIYHWFSLDLDGKKIGYILCYCYSFNAKTRMQKQVIFNNLMIEDVYMPDAVNTVISTLKKMEQRHDIYVVNNSTLLKENFYSKSGFFPGFARFQPYLRCRPKNSKIEKAFQEVNNTGKFSLSVI